MAPIVSVAVLVMVVAVVAALSKCWHSNKALVPAVIAADGTAVPGHWRCERCDRTWPLWTDEGARMEVSGVVMRGGAGRYDESKAVAGARRAAAHATQRRRAELRRGDAPARARRAPTPVVPIRRAGKP